MFDEHETDWMERCADVQGATFNVLFLAQNQFFLGNPNNSTQIDDRSFYVDVPSAELAPRCSAHSELFDESLLIIYYKDIIELSNNRLLPDFLKARYSDFNYISQYFWMRLTMTWSGGGINFPWYDTWEEMESLLGRIDSARCDFKWYDVDQGWEMQTVQKGDVLFLRDGDGEGEIQHAIRVKLSDILPSVEALRLRVPKIIESLVESLGADVWTKRKYIGEVTFGTLDWQPGQSDSAKKRLSDDRRQLGILKKIKNWVKGRF